MRIDEVAQRPLALAEHRHRRLEELVVGDGDRVVEVEAREVGAKPSRPQRERSLGVGVAPEVVVPCLRGGLGGTRDHDVAVDDLDVVGIPARGGGAGTDVGYRFAQHFFRGRADEDDLGILGTELLAAVGRTGLVEHRCALQGRLTQMDSGDPEVLPLVLDRVHLGRVGVVRAAGSVPTASSSQEPSHSLYRTSVYSSAMS